MKKRIQSLWFLGALVLFLSVGVALHAQQTGRQNPPPDSQAQQPSQAQPNQPPDQSGQQTPDSQAQSSATQTFTGTIVKSGNKWVFQDAASGNTYDIDHQDEVQKFEGKKVKVHGVLDANAKTIHVQ
jgi:uncharacterized protein YdeI (BOF family)